MAWQKRTTIKASLAFTLALVLAFACVVPARAANPFDSLTHMFSGNKSKTTKKKTSADNEKAGLAATGCIAGAILSKANGADAGQGCAQGAIKNITEQDEKEEQEMLIRKDSQAWGQRIDAVNARVLERQPRIERISAEKKGIVEPADPKNIAVDKKCKADPACLQAAVEAAEEAGNPGFFKRAKYWLFPGSAPAAKEELKGIESDIALLQRSVREIRAEISAKEDGFDSARDVKQKSDIAREKGVLVFELSQATETLTILKEQRDELDKSYLSYICAAFTAVGATFLKKFSDGAVQKTLDGVKGLAAITTRRRRSSPSAAAEKKHSMY